MRHTKSLWIGLLTPLIIFSLPVKGDTRQHGSKAWRIDRVEIDRTAPKALPIYCVYLKEVEN